MFIKKRDRNVFFERTDIMERKSGFLLAVFSLPSNYGIGTFGKEAYRFVDFLKRCRQSYWQMLPLNPTGFGDSPYQSFSAFALNPYFIDLDFLKDEGLLTEEDLKPLAVDSKAYIDYGHIYETRFTVLRKAFDNAHKSGKLYTDEFINFLKENEAWLNPYAAFMVLKNLEGGRAYTEWSDEHKHYSFALCQKVLSVYKDDSLFYAYLQFKANEQYAKLRKYANDNGIKIVGDIPIYVAADSADVWSNPTQFLLSEDLSPAWVAGVPPDYFSAVGQLWGNPIYNYAQMEKDGFAWWKSRININAKFFDVLRIDHFRGMADYWMVPKGSETAINGHWEIGPGQKLVDAINEACGGKLSIIAEDLGVLHPIVEDLKAYSTWPGMKIFQFGFDSRKSDDPQLPNNYISNLVGYLGTHDNQTTVGFLKQHPELYPDIQRYLAYSDPNNLLDGMITNLAYSKADTVIFTLQDFLALDDSARLNVPSTSGGINWQWRLPGEYDTRIDRINFFAELTRKTGRE